MNIDERRLKLEDWRWNLGKEGIAGTGLCPLRNGTSHRIALSTSGTSCLGNPRCDAKLIAAFFANGVSVPVETNGHVVADLTSWRLKLYEYGHQVFGKAGGKSMLAGTDRTTLVDTLVTDYRSAIDARHALATPLPPLTSTDLEEELYAVAGAAVDAFLKVQLPAVSEPTEGGALVEYVDRMAVDAYDAYAQMVGEHREYSWSGLIRDGCTAVLSALIGAGKSTFAMNLARAWGLGVPFLDHECRQSKTLVVVSPKEYEAWIDTIGFWELKGLVYIVPSTAAHFTTHKKTAEWFDYQMQTFQCRTFVLDTLFDFFGMPPNNSGDSNRIAMNEQTPLLQMVRERNYSGLVTGHAPKSEAKAIDPRDPEESFGGHTAWTAQHRMRMTIRRKSHGVNAFVTGRGGFGDKGILKEQLLHFDEASRLDSLGGLFSDHLGEAAMPEVVDVLRDFCEPVSMPQLIEAMGKSPKWVKAGVRTGRKKNVIGSDAAKGKRDSKYWLLEQVLEHVLEQPKLL